jgi:hypothetical protein
MRTLEHPREDELLELVNGLLPESARREIVEHARACAACSESLRRFAATHARSHVRALDSLERADSSLAGPPHAMAAAAAAPASARSILRLPSRRVPALAAAAALIVAVGGYLAFSAARRDAATDVGPIAWLPAPEGGILARDSQAGGADPDVAEGLAAYRNRDLSNARRLLARARAEGALEQVRLLYLGDARLRLGETRAALETLRSIDFDQVPEPWKSESRWALSLAFEAEGRRNEADSLWQLLEVRTDEIGERARQARHAPRPSDAR